MPSYACSSSVFSHENLLEPLRSYSGEATGYLPSGKEERGNVVRLTKHSLIEVILPAEGDHTSFPDVALELEFLEWKLPHLRQQPLLHIRREDIGLILKSHRHTRTGTKKPQLFSY